MCLSILHSFTSQLLTELRNVNMILKQLQKNQCFKRVKKDELPCWLNNKKKLVTYIFLLALSFRAAALLFISSLNSTSCSAVANCITGILTTVIPCSSNASVSLFGYSKSLLVQIQQRPKQRQRHKYFMIQLAYHEKTYNSKER